MHTPLSTNNVMQYFRMVSSERNYQKVTSYKILESYQLAMIFMPGFTDKPKMNDSLAESKLGCDALHPYGGLPLLPQ